MRFITPLCCCLALLAFGLVGEVVVIAGLLVVAVGAWWWFKTRSTAAVLSALAVTALVLHSRGYKLYGSAVIVDVPKLMPARELVALRSPGTLLFKDGGSTVLEGVYVLVDADPFQPESLRSFRGTPRPDALNSVRLSRPNSDRSRAEYQTRMDYWCGNTFFPAICPNRLPRYRTSDFAELLVSCALAIPDRQATEDPAYADELWDAFARRVGIGSAFYYLRVHQQDPVAVRIGRTQLQANDELFVAAATVLIAAQDHESYGTIRREILRRQRLNRDTYDAVAQSCSGSLDELLVWIDPAFANQRFLKAVSGIRNTPNELNTAQWGLISAVMPVLSHGGLDQLDPLVMELDEERSERRQIIASVLPRLFNWPETSRGFQQWYWENRQNLRAGRDRLGQVAIMLGEEEPFGVQYIRSMQEVAAR